MYFFLKLGKNDKFLVKKNFSLFMQVEKIALQKEKKKGKICMKTESSIWITGKKQLSNAATVKVMCFLFTHQKKTFYTSLLLCIKYDRI